MLSEKSTENNWNRYYSPMVDAKKMTNALLVKDYSI